MYIPNLKVVREAVKGLKTTHALYVRHGPLRKRMLWGRVRADTQAEAEAYFADQYPSHDREVVEDHQRELHDQVDPKTHKYRLSWK